MLKAKRDSVTTVPVTRPPLESLEAPRDGVKNTTNIVTNPDRTTVVDLDRVPATHLLQYTQGSPWPVMWFRRLWGKNDPKKIFDPEVINPTQQTERIINLVLKVNTTLTPQQDVAHKTFTRAGNAKVALSVVPNEHDFFIAALGDSRFGLFDVQSSTRMTDNKVAVYEIEYTMLFEVSDTIHKAIEASVQRTYHYVAERAWVGIDPLLTPDEFRRFNSQETYQRIIEETYVQRFFNRDIRSLAYPDVAETYYDAYLVMFVKELGLRHTPDDLRVYPHNPMRVEDVFTLWKLLGQRSTWQLGSVEKNGNWYSAKTFRARHGMNTVAYSKVRNSFAFEGRFNINQFIAGAVSKEVWPVAVAFEPQQIVYRGIEGETLPAYLPLSRDEHYVLSRAFYEGSYASGLEYGLYCYLNNTPTPSNLATQLAELLPKLPQAEQLYYTPLVYLLLKYTR